MTVQILVIAKAPEPGRSKTRLSPPLTPSQAAAVAEAALTDTLAAVAATPATRRVLVLEGEVGPWLPSGFDVLPQRGEGLDERLTAAFLDAGCPSFLIGMDTPQVTPELLEGCLAAMDNHDVVLGPAHDGGWWGIGSRIPVARLFEGVPMSTNVTADAQRDRLRDLGLVWHELPGLRDVDTMEDARAVADEAPDTLFARALRSLV